MRITVDIDEGLVADAMAITQEKNKSPAIAKAVEEFVRRAKAREFGRLIRESAFDYYGDEPSPETESMDPVPPLQDPPKA